MKTVEEVKSKLLEMATDCKNSTINEVLCRHSELSEVYNTNSRDTLLTNVGSDDPLIHTVVKKRLAGDPAPWLDANDCIEYLSECEFDTEDHLHMAETDGQITSIRSMMLFLGMVEEAKELSWWLYY